MFLFCLNYMSCKTDPNLKVLPYLKQPVFSSMAMTVMCISALVIRSSWFMRHINAGSMASLASPYFFCNYLINNMILVKNIFHMECVL